jgi:hypothetical protein
VTENGDREQADPQARRGRREQPAQHVAAELVGAEQEAPVPAAASGRGY